MLGGSHRGGLRQERQWRVASNVNTENPGRRD